VEVVTLRLARQGIPRRVECDECGIEADAVDGKWPPPGWEYASPDWNMRYDLCPECKSKSEEKDKS
jgi:hypothetical protein